MTEPSPSDRLTTTARPADAPDLPEDQARAEDLRALALKRLKDRRGLMAHALAYVTVNLLLAATWFASGRGFFWPVFPIFGWGIGLVFHAWGVFWPEPGEDQISREIERIRQQRR